MPLNKLENFIKNYEGRILYVNSNDLDATDSITNAGNSLTKPFKTIQRALIEAARFSFVTGNDNDKNDRTTILVFPGEHVIDNRPGYGIRKLGTALAQVETPSGEIISPAADAFNLTLETNFDITQEDNVLYKFNSIHGGVILPRGTSLVGLDLRKTKIRPKYVPNPTDPTVPTSSIFRITGNCYFWQFSLFDANENELVYTNNKVFTAGSGNLSLPTFSHHKLTCFEYADGVNIPDGYDITDLDMYYAKLSQAFNEGSGKQIPASQKFPLSPQSFAKERPEWEIVGAFGTDPVNIATIISGDGATPGPIVTVTTVDDHGLTAGTPIKIRGLDVNDYNVSTVVQSVINSKKFTYVLSYVRNDLDANPPGSGTVTIETDTVKGASPYIFNCSLRSVWGMNGMKADGSKASGFKSMVVAQFTAVSLQKDDRAFVKYDPITRTYNGIEFEPTIGTLLSSQSSSTITSQVYHLDSDAIYRPGWEPSHIKIINDAFIQIVSVFAIGFNKHFDAQSGGDGSITNSNSNFGQYSLAAEGFKREAFNKDDNAFITSIITPRYIPPVIQNIDWIPIDINLTSRVGLSSHLYLFGFNSQDNVPPNLIQGYRIGAKKDEVLYLTLPNGDVKSANVLMTNNVVSSSSTVATGNNSSVKQYTVSLPSSAPDYEILTLSTTHNLQTGEKILILSDSGDLPENLTENKIYYTIKVSNTSIKVASSFTNAQNGVGIRMYGGTKLRVLSRVSDRDSGELGSPIQYDPNNSNWFVYVNSGNDIYSSILSLGVVGFGEPRTDVTYVKRIEDSRSLDEKIYKVRIVIPKESVNAKDPTDGFVIQESSTTGPINDSELSLSNINVRNYNYKRNPRFISTCSASGAFPNQIVTVTTELPHNLTTGDRVFIKNVKSSTNINGIGFTGYNGDFNVTVVDHKTFTYPIRDNDGVTHNVGIFSSPTSRDTTLPRFERNDWKSNFYIYRSETLSPYIYNVQDGIYHAYILKSDNAVPDTFTDYQYSQSIVDLYPQKDPDNIDDNPNAAQSFAKRSPLGEVVTNDLKKSVTRETVDTLVKKLGVTPIIQNTSAVLNGISTITTELHHGLNGIVGYTTFTSGTGYSIGTYFNVKLLNSETNTWNGATANLTVSGVGGSITSFEIADGGSGYSPTTLNISGFFGSTVAISTQTISRSENNVIQVTGLGTATDGLYRIVSVPAPNKIAIARTSGDPQISPGQYILNVSPSIVVDNTTYDVKSGVSTITCISAHGLVAGNKFKIVDNSSNNIGDYVVNDIIGINTFTFKSLNNPGAPARVLKYGFSSNDLISAAGDENLGARGVSFYANETALLLEDVGTDSVTGVSAFSITPSNSGISTTLRFPLGSYIQINNEIMRIASNTLTGFGNNKITVLRGVLGTQKEFHPQNSLIKKIKPLAIEFRRPSILRASGHTFEYLGFGPGNYSTGLPQIQTRTLTERADFLSQSQEKSCGSVVYTGMNSDGDFFIGNTKYSSASGEQITFDIPIPTVTGQDPSRLSAVFDEIIVKERILVEGGKSKQILSQFDGPVTFNENIIINNTQTKINGELISSGLVKFNNTTQSDSVTTGALVTKGGVGIAKNLYVGGIASIAGEITINTGIIPDTNNGAYIGSATTAFSEAYFGNIRIAATDDQTIDTRSGNLRLDSSTGNTILDDNVSITETLNVTGVSTFTGLIDANGGAEIDNIRIGVADNNEIDTSTGNLTIDSAGGLTTIDDDVRITEDLDVDGSFNLKGVLKVGEGIIPDTDEGAYIGTTSLPFSELHVGELQLAVGDSGNDDNTIKTATGNLYLDSLSGTTFINDNLNVSGSSLFNDNVTLRGSSKTFEIQDSNGYPRLRVNSNTGSLTIDGVSSKFTVDGLNGNTTIGDSSNGILAVKNTLQASSPNSGALVVSGGAGISRKLYVGDQLTVTSGGMNVTGNSLFNNAVTVASGGATITGGLEVNNGITLNSGPFTTYGRIVSQVSNDAISSTDTNAAFSTIGGAAIAKNLYVGARLFGIGGATISNGLTLSSGNLSVSGGSITASSNIQGTNIIASGGTLQGALQNALSITTSDGQFSYNNTAPRSITIPRASEILGHSAAGLGFNGTSRAAATYVQIWYATPIAEGGSLVLRGQNGGCQFGSGGVTTSGDVTAFGTVTTSSDDRLKTNKLPISNSLEKLLSLNGFTYDWNEKAKDLGIESIDRQIGVSAQEVQKVLPEIVKSKTFGESEEEFLTVSYERLVPVLIEAIKELKSELDELKNSK